MTHPVVAVHLEQLGPTSDKWAAHYGIGAEQRSAMARCYSEQAFFAPLAAQFEENSHDKRWNEVFSRSDQFWKLLDGRTYWLSSRGDEATRYVETLRSSDRFDARVSQVRRIMEGSRETQIFRSTAARSRSKIEAVIATGRKSGKPVAELEKIVAAYESNEKSLDAMYVEATLLAAHEFSDDEFEKIAAFWSSETGGWYADMVEKGIMRSFEELDRCLEAAAK